MAILYLVMLLGLSPKAAEQGDVCIFLNSVETLFDHVRAEPTEAGKMLPLAPTASENLHNANSEL